MVSKPGTYWLEVTQNGCSQRDSITIQSRERPVFSLGEDRTLCLGETWLLEVPIPGLTYKWNNGVTTSNLLITGPGIFRVTVDNGCETVEDEILIEYENCQCDLELANIITPNQDGKNDRFLLPTHQNIRNLRLEIYNRYGVKLFERSGPGTDWDGKGAAEGIYFYLLRYDCQESGHVMGKKKKGYITLVR